MTTHLLPMDRACLAYLVEYGDDGAVPSIAIPARLFRGEIPEGTPNMVELGLIENIGDYTKITDVGRRALQTGTV